MWTPDIHQEIKKPTRVIIRDESDYDLGACRRITLCVSSIFGPKAISTIHGLRLAIDMGFQNVILESDSRYVIKMIKERAEEFSTISSLIHEAHELRSFGCVPFSL